MKEKAGLVVVINRNKPQKKRSVKKNIKQQKP